MDEVATAAVNSVREQVAYTNRLLEQLLERLDNALIELPNGVEALRVITTEA